MCLPGRMLMSRSAEEALSAHSLSHDDAGTKRLVKGANVRFLTSAIHQLVLVLVSTRRDMDCAKSVCIVNLNILKSAL